MKNPFKTNSFYKDKGIDNFEKFYTKDGCYHVKVYERRAGLAYNTVTWECFDTWTQARKFFIKQIRNIRNEIN